MTGDAATDQRAQNEAQEHVERTDAADRAAFADTNDRQDRQINKDRAGHGLVQLERIVGKIAAKNKVQDFADSLEGTHGAAPVVADEWRPPASVRPDL